MIFAVLTGTGIVALLNFARYWVTIPDWHSNLPGSLLLSAILVVTLANQHFRWGLLPQMRRPVPMLPQAHRRVAVATAFVPGPEPFEMLENTLKALVEMDGPHDTWVLDEGDDARVKALCRQYGALHFSRRGMAQYHAERGPFESYSKHGNYNAWLHEIAFDRYEFFAAFDSDHIPRRCFLDRVLGYFADPTIGFVQVAQDYYNQNASFIARGAAEETYEYYSITQMANFGLDYPTIVGCHNTHRVSSLREAGGFAAHEADDLLLTLRYRARGWRGVYVPMVLARGLAPVDWAGYLTQQRRWARSVLDIKLRQARLPKSAPWTSRLVFTLHGLNYLQPIVLAVMTLSSIVYALWTGWLPSPIARPDWLAILPVAAAIALYEIFRQHFYLDPRERGIPWRSRLLRIAKWPCMALALMDVLCGRRFRYTLTRKSGRTGRTLALAKMHAPAFAAVSIAWAVGTFSGRLVDPRLHTIAGTVLLLIAGIAASGFFSYPDPFDSELAELQAEPATSSTGVVR